MSRHGVYDSLRPVFIVSTLLGMTPFCNVRSSTSKNLKFQWLSLQTLYSLVVLVVLVFGTYLMVTSHTYLFSNLLDINDVVLSLTGPVFYISNTITVIQSINVTRKLPALLRHWDVTATRLLKYLPGEGTGSNAGLIDLPNESSTSFSNGGVFASKRLVTAIAAALAISSTAEVALHDINLPLLLCHNNYTNYFQCYMMRGNPHFNDAFGHSVPLATCFWIVQKYANVAWHFHDIFIIVLALPLRANYKILAEYVRKHNHDIDSHKTWRIVDLTERLDKVVSKMILQSYAVNLFYLCFQGSLAIRPIDRKPVQMVYYCYSLAHLAVRTCTVSAAASSIHEQAKAPLPYLFECPSATYCTEVYRFVNQITSIEIGLTGYEFFVVTRGIFLALLSVLITYELILLRMA